MQNLLHENEVDLHGNDPDGQSSLCFCRELTIFFCIFAGKSQHPIKQGGTVIRSNASKPATVCGEFYSTLGWEGGAGAELPTSCSPVNFFPTYPSPLSLCLLYCTRLRFQLRAVPTVAEVSFPPSLLPFPFKLPAPFISGLPSLLSPSLHCYPSSFQDPLRLLIADA